MAAEAIAASKLVIGLDDEEIDPERTGIRLDVVSPRRAGLVGISAAEQHCNFRQVRYHLFEYLDALTIDTPVHRGEAGDVAARAHPGWQRARSGSGP